MKEMQRIGWREWVSLPDLGISWVKAKTDTGARTSALDVKKLDTFMAGDKAMVRIIFRKRKKVLASKPEVTVPVLESRTVKDSGGKEHKRVVIETTLVIGGDSHQIELTLSDRRKMRFPMLIGRTAIRKKYLVDSGRSYLTGKPAHK